MFLLVYGCRGFLQISKSWLWLLDMSFYISESVLSCDLSSGWVQKNHWFQFVQLFLDIRIGIMTSTFFIYDGLNWKSLYPVFDTYSFNQLVHVLPPVLSITSVSVTHSNFQWGNCFEIDKQYGLSIKYYFLTHICIMVSMRCMPWLEQIYASGSKSERNDWF